MPEAAWDKAGQTWDATTEIYQKGGAPALAGAGLGLAADVVNPLRKLKIAKQGAEALDELGDAAKAAKKAKHLDGKEESGNSGLRVTRRPHKVQCFDMPPGLDPKEYDRQLAEQMKTINEMTADDMAYAHWVLEKAGGTGALRQPGAQRAMRRQYEMDYRSANPNLTDAQIADHMSGLHATHWLDMIAGGDPSALSGLGHGNVNSDIGRQWIRDGRAASLRDEAAKMRKAGRASEKMQVELKRC